MVACGFDCGVCGKTLASKSSLACHQLRHKDLDGLPKQLKGRIDKTSRNAGIDQLLIRPKKEVECEICGKKLSGKTPLAYHKRTHLEEDSDSCFPCKCSLCDKRFTTLSSLKIHRHTHIDEEETRPFDCDICGKKLFTKSAVTTHKFTHLAVEERRKRFKCECCGKYLSTVASLRRHVLTHSSK